MPWIPPQVRAGRYPDAADLEDLYNQVASLTSGWADYNPVWTTDGTPPSIGNGSVTGTYRFPNESDLVHAQVRFIAGSTTTYGTSFWSFSLPTTAAGFEQLCGFGSLLDSGTIRRPLSTHAKSITQAYVDSDGGSITATVPHTWAVNDEIIFNIFFRPA